MSTVALLRDYFAAGRLCCTAKEKVLGRSNQINVSISCG